MNKLLNDVYYNPKSAACYSSARNVYVEAKRRNKNVTLDDVNDFLMLQPAFTLHHKARKRFDRNATRTAGIDVDWQSDLADMHTIKKYNKGYCYIVVCIDVLSRYAFAEIVKRKTPEEVGTALKKIIKDSGRKPWFLLTDRGKEYSGKPFQDMVRHYDIRHRYATSPDVKCAIAERYIRTLKSRIWRYFTRHKTLNYVDVLPELVEAINNSHHRTIGCKPSQVNKGNADEIWQRLYGKQYKKKKRTRFMVGEKVRISKEKHKLSKGYLPNFTDEIFVISKILKNRYPATYRISDLAGEELEGIFYNEELVRVAKPSKLVKKIAAIVKSEKRKNKLWHYVKWQDKKKKPSWIKDSDLVTK